MNERERRGQGKEREGVQERDEWHLFPYSHVPSLSERPEGSQPCSPPLKTTIVPHTHTHTHTQTDTHICIHTSIHSITHTDTPTHSITQRHTRAQTQMTSTLSVTHTETHRHKHTHTHHTHRCLNSLDGKSEIRKSPKMVSHLKTKQKNGVD